MKNDYFNMVAYNFYAINNKKFGIESDENIIVGICSCTFNIFMKFEIIDNNRIISNTKEMAKFLNIQYDDFKKRIKKIDKNISIFNEKIIFRPGIYQKISNFFIKEFNVSDYRVDFANLKYWKFDLYIDGLKIDLNEVFKYNGMNYKEFVYEIFNEQNLNEPNLLILAYEVGFENKDDVFDFIIISMKNLLTKINNYKIIKKLEEK